MVRPVIIGSVVAAAVVAGGAAALIWWLVTRGDDGPPRYETIPLQGEGFGNVTHKAAFTRIPGSGDMFWWFYPTLAENATTKPLVLWLDGVTGLPPSLLANFGMFGPFDFNLNRRNHSWIEEYNLLFVDAPLGAGFSTILNGTEISGNLANNTEHLLLTLESFYSDNEDFLDTPLYIFGQGYGAQLALSLALGLNETEHVSPNVTGVVLGNPVISPALALTQLGFYLEELGYIDGNGRAATENFTNNTLNFVNQGQWEEAFDNFISLGEFVNEQAGAVAVNLAHIVEKLNNQTLARDVFGQRKYLSDTFNLDFERFMNETVADALGIQNATFNEHGEDVLQAFRENFMVPATDTVETLLDNTNLTIAIYNGNLDAVSNTPGQLEWIDSLQWSGQAEFLSSPRNTLVINSFIEGYFRETNRMKFYWLTRAGLSVPLDNPIAIRRVIQRIMNE